MERLCSRKNLKSLKASLKEWHKSHVVNLDAQISVAKEDLNRWDLLGEGRALS